jgi:hypothetical protein
MHPSSLCVLLDFSEIEQIYHGENWQPFNKHVEVVMDK